MTRTEHGTAPAPGRFMVEVTRPRAGSIDVAALSDRARDAARQSDPARPVRFVRAVAVPEDGSCLLVFEGPGRADVEAVATTAGVSVRNITRVIAIETDPSSTNPHEHQREPGRRP